MVCATQECAFGGLRRWGSIAALTTCTMLGACAQATKPSLPELLSPNEASTQAAESQPADTGKSELVKATEYWGKEYAKDPRNLEAALGYAKNLKAMGEKKRALAVLQHASILHGNSRELANEYGRLALEFDQVSLANRLLAAADDPVNPDWRVISARGTVLAKQGKYKEAIPFYERALTLAHNHPSILSNLALAHAMNGEPKRAEELLRQAAAIDRNSLKIRQNLALVLGLQGKYDEAKLLASRDLPAESAAEDTDFLRRLVKLEPERRPVAEPARYMAKVKPAPPVPMAKPHDENVADVQIEPFRTSVSKKAVRRKEVPAQKLATLRRTMTPTPPAGLEMKSEKPKDVSDAAASFSVAQWTPETRWASLEKEPTNQRSAQASGGE